MLPFLSVLDSETDMFGLFCRKPSQVLIGVHVRGYSDKGRFQCLISGPHLRRQSHREHENALPATAAIFFFFAIFFCVWRNLNRVLSCLETPLPTKHSLIARRNTVDIIHRATLRRKRLSLQEYALPLASWEGQYIDLRLRSNEFWLCVLLDCRQLCPKTQNDTYLCKRRYRIVIDGVLLVTGQRMRLIGVINM